MGSALELIQLVHRLAVSMGECYADSSGRDLDLQMPRHLPCGVFISHGFVRGGVRSLGITDAEVRAVAFILLTWAVALSHLVVSIDAETYIYGVRLG